MVERGRDPNAYGPPGSSCRFSTSSRAWLSRHTSTIVRYPFAYNLCGIVGIQRPAAAHLGINFHSFKQRNNLDCNIFLSPNDFVSYLQSSMHHSVAALQNAKMKWPTSVPETAHSKGQVFTTRAVRQATFLQSFNDRRWGGRSGGDSTRGTVNVLCAISLASHVEH